MRASRISPLLVGSGLKTRRQNPGDNWGNLDYVNSSGTKTKNCLILCCNLTTSPITVASANLARGDAPIDEPECGGLDEQVVQRALLVPKDNECGAG